MHFALHTPNPEHCTLHPKPYTLNPNPVPAGRLATHPPAFHPPPLPLSASWAGPTSAVPFTPPGLVGGTTSAVSSHPPGPLHPGPAAWGWTEFPGGAVPLQTGSEGPAGGAWSTGPMAPTPSQWLQRAPSPQAIPAGGGTEHVPPPWNGSNVCRGGPVLGEPAPFLETEHWRRPAVGGLLQ